MEIKGYKAFNVDKTNRYGKPFEEGKTYHTDEDIKFTKTGFHMCKHLSDVFRYFKGLDVVVAEVTGSGKYEEMDLDDWFPPYYEMYAVSDITINKFLSRNEIIELMLNASEYDVIKFIQTFDLTIEEGKLFANKFINKKDILKALIYYVFKDENAYTIPYNEESSYIKKYL